MIVYKVTSPSGKCYIGVTSRDLEFRKQCHYQELKTGTNYNFHNAIRKYSDQLVWEVICECTTGNYEDLKSLEKYYIQKYRSYNNGYNMTLGGDGTLGWKHTEETKAKMRGPRPQTSIAMKGKKKSEEHKRKISETRKNSLVLKETMNTEEFKNKMALAGGGKPFNVFKKIDNSFVETWINQSQCERDLNIDGSVISKCLKHPDRVKSHKGYVFKYIEEGVLF